jgi:hypothetical protein
MMTTSEWPGAQLRRLLAIGTLGVAFNAHAATITIVNADGPGEGLNDPTPVAPAGGNSGTTLGAQRLGVLQRAAQIWGTTLQSSVEIKVSAQFNPIIGCSAISGTVGFAGPTAGSVFPPANTPPGAMSDVIYPIALAEALVGANLNGGSAEINMTLNSDVDGDTCFGDTRFWYGTDTATPVPAQRIALLPVVLHEIAHGLGFLSLACTDSNTCTLGSFPSNKPDIWSFLMADLQTGKTWDEMSNVERAASMANDPQLVWMGTAVANGLPSAPPGPAALQGGRLRLHAPSPIVVGSSVSHYTQAADPLLMKPVLSPTLFAQLDLTPALMSDIGWTLVSGGGLPNTIYRNGFEQN